MEGLNQYIRPIFKAVKVFFLARRYTFPQVQRFCGRSAAEYSVPQNSAHKPYLAACKQYFAVFILNAAVYAYIRLEKLFVRNNAC